MAQAISLTSDVVASRDQVSCTLSGAAAILQVDHGIYYSLDEVGARIWELLQEPTTVQHLRDVVCAEYAVERDQCERDLFALLQELADARLIEIKT